MKQTNVLLITLFLYSVNYVICCEDEDRLMGDLLRGYNSLIQPIRNISEAPMIVKIAMQLTLLINIDEKNQIMQTNVWLTLQWQDFQMHWNPVNYGAIDQIRMTPDKVWLPDIVLFNNADGNFEVSYMCNVVIKNNGEMLWVPPAIYKSYCKIDVDYFPFDEQVCTLKFGSWTYNSSEMQLEFVQAKLVDLSQYEFSSIWDITSVPAQLVNDRSRIEFTIKLRRKTLFYTVVLIIPTLLMAFLNITVFFLPTDSTEKMTLIVNVLLSIVLFLLLISKILPPTSTSIPLMARYLLLTFVLNVITILLTVVVINVYCRSPRIHRMPQWVRRLFLEFMPPLLCMKRSKAAGQRYQRTKKLMAQLPGVGKFALTQAKHHPLCPSADDRTSSKREQIEMEQDPATRAFYPLSPDALKAIDAIEFITEHLRQDEEDKMYRDDWKYVAMILDRLLLYIYFGITLGGSCGILFSAPSLFQGVNQKEIHERLKALYQSGGYTD